jgi:hypothetical protein
MQDAIKPASLNQKHNRSADIVIEFNRPKPYGADGILVEFVVLIRNETG